MRKNPYLPHPKLLISQNEKLRNLIHYAYKNVLYYRELFDKCSLSPHDINNLEDLRRIPITTKKRLQSLSLERKISGKVDFSECVRVTTSGSTGIPLEIFYLKNDYSRINMNWIRPLLMNGVKPWHKKLEITGPHNISERKKWYQYLKLWRTKGVSIFNPPEEMVSIWNSYKPDVLYGYSGSLKLLAKHIKKNKVNNINPKYIFGVSDFLDEESREYINSTFKNEIIDLYGAAESGCISWQCKYCKDYHINTDTVIVEFIKNGRPALPGEHGKIIITNLYSYAMPLIRYDLEDVGIISKDSSVCGINLPLMKVMEGRSDAFVVLPSGDLLSPMFFFGIMKPIKNILNWRVVQENPGEIIVYFVPDKKFNSNTCNSIIKRIKENIRERINIHIKPVRELNPDRSGKIRSVISFINYNWTKKN